MRGPLLTTRQWMAVVLVAAGLTASYAQLRRWYCQYWQAELAAAIGSEQAYRAAYDDERVTPLRYLEESERVMRARLALSLTTADRTAATSAHVTQAERVLKREQDRLLENGCCRGGATDVAETRAYYDDLRARLARR